MCACAFYQLQDHWMFLLPRRSTRLVTEEKQHLFIFFAFLYDDIHKPCHFSHDEILRAQY